MLLYQSGPREGLMSRLRARAVKWLFRRQWVKTGLPRYWVQPGDAIGREILTQGLFEKPTLLGLRYLLGARGGTLLDIGANIGNHAVFLAPLFARVVAFEPNPTAFRILEANIALNRLKNVTAVNKGLGAHAASLPFYENTAGNLGASGFVKSATGTRTGTFAVATGDAELARLKIKPSSIRVVKIDVEGLETEVIAGLKNTLKAAHPVVLFEVLEGAHGTAIALALGKLGYRHFYELAEKHTWLRGQSVRLKRITLIDNRYYALVAASAKPLH